MRNKIIAIAAIAFAPALAWAQTSVGFSSGVQLRDTSTQRADTSTIQRSDTTNRQRNDTTVQSSVGRLTPTMHRAAVNNRGLTNDQVKQLQQAINNAGCNSGPVDGLIGPQTRAGIQCVRKQKNVSGTGLNPVLQAMNLSFTAPSTPSGATSPRSPSDTSMHHGRIRPTDTTMIHRRPPHRVQHGTTDTTAQHDTTHTSH